MEYALDYSSSQSQLLYCKLMCKLLIGRMTIIMRCNLPTGRRCGDAADTTTVFKTQDNNNSLSLSLPTRESMILDRGPIAGSPCTLAVCVDQENALLSYSRWLQDRGGVVTSTLFGLFAASSVLASTSLS